MPSDNSRFRLLVKTAAGPAGVRLSLNGQRFNFTMTPLQAAQRRGVARAIGWHVLTPSPSPGHAEDWGVTNPWEMCHELVRGGLGVAGGPQVEFAEPDLQQQWLVGRPGAIVTKLGLNGPTPDPQNSAYPKIFEDDFWYKDDQHAQWALTNVGDPGDGNRVRVAHLDTGYDPHHATCPLHLAGHLQKNFVDADRPNDASDDSSGFFNNLGHGTGTLSILAGAGVDGSKPFGCAPFVEVVPIRVANSVVLFFNSAIFQALNYVLDLSRASATRVHVVTMSMGGIASQSWAEAVNALYEAGVFVVTAAGNNFGNFPTHEIVYPARFGRVVAACGVMADQRPYADLSMNLLAGNYGPADKMQTAVAAYTPNVPWARFGGSKIVDWDGNGTSAATPQIAAAAALWIQKNRKEYEKYPQGWQRVEAVRAALFEKAKIDANYAKFFGRGKLAAKDMLDAVPAPANKLAKQVPDSARFPFFTPLTGFGFAAVPAHERAMLELEALQVMQTSKFNTVLPDPLAPVQTLDPRLVARFVEEFRSKPGLSKALRNALEPGRTTAPLRPQHSSITALGGVNPTDALHHCMADKPKAPEPLTRALRVFAYDPSASTDMETFGVNDATISIRWERDLKPGPVGEYLEVVDVDPASGSCYAPIDLNDPNLLAQNGLAPSEANPQFHQQMCYAVAMRTIDHFERALGRKALWSTRYLYDSTGAVIGHEFVPRLRIYPHALRTANSFYSPDRKALLLGYFRADTDNAGNALPGSHIFCAVSHDIIAHETTHALLDGLHRRYQEPTNPDVLAFHEAFADIVAIFQHFTMPEALHQQIRRTRGDLSQQDSLLAKLAIQFGQATLQGGQALRDALEKKADRSDYETSMGEPHAHGAVLVSAVFDAFLRIYKARTCDLIRLATAGSGVLAPGEIPFDLVDRLTTEAAKVAGHVLGICIRALDYCPPIDITFGEYLRALITADFDAVRDDNSGYRVAFISAFRDRGIFPSNVAHLAVDSLVWEPPPLSAEALVEVIDKLNFRWSRYEDQIDLIDRDDLAGSKLGVDRRIAHEASEHNRREFWHWLNDPKNAGAYEVLGFLPAKKVDTIDDIAGEVRAVEIHSVRLARRITKEGRINSDVVVEITQTFRPAAEPLARIRGGCTLIVDLQSSKPRYLIRKRLDGSDGVQKQFKFHTAIKGDSDDSSLRSNYYDAPATPREPFALLHGRH